MSKQSLEQEVAMFGCDMEAFRKSLEGSVAFTVTGPGMCAASLMSDAQELIERGAKEDARQTLNRAKWIVFTYLMGKEKQ